jgi:hypothetical protein
MNDNNQTTPAKPWWGYKGMSAIEYAAIHTGQPCSGTPWLDDMIAKGRRERLAGQALASMTIAPDYSKGPCNEAMIERAFILADLAVTALEGGEK